MFWKRKFKAYKTQALTFQNHGPRILSRQNSHVPGVQFDHVRRLLGRARPRIATPFANESLAVSFARAFVDGGCKVPFRDYSGFNEEMLRNMTAAYDDAVAKLNIKRSDPLTSKIAARIAALAAGGERDPAKLCEGAIAGLRK